MPYIGPVSFPYLSAQDNTRQRPVEERNFMGESPVVEEFAPSLESGTFNAALIPEDHPQNLNLNEQLSAVRALSEWTPAENVYAFNNDAGYLAVENVSTTDVAETDYIDAQMTLRYMEDADYRPAMTQAPSSRTDDFSVSPQSYYALPANVTDVQYVQDDGSYANPSPTHTVSTFTGDINLYDLSTDRLLYEYPSSNFAEPERTANVRSANADNERVFEQYTDLRGGEISNGLIRAFFDESNNEITVRYYDAGGDLYLSLGTITVELSDSVLVENSSLGWVVRSGGKHFILPRGAPYFVIQTDYESLIQWETTDGGNITNELDGSTRQGTVDTTNKTFDYYITRNRIEGDFGTSEPVSYTDVPDGSWLAYGFDAGGLTWSEAARWSLTEEDTERHLVARSSLP